MDTTLLDRLLALAPLAVLAWFIKRAETERATLLRQLAEDREHYRNERRELINRVQFPFKMPVATQPIRPVDRRDPDLVSAAERERQSWNGVGTAAPALPGDLDDVPGAE